MSQSRVLYTPDSRGEVIAGSQDHAASCIKVNTHHSSIAPGESTLEVNIDTLGYLPDLDLPISSSCSKVSE